MRMRKKSLNIGALPSHADPIKDLIESLRYGE